MKPRNKFERELQAYIDGGRLHTLTPKQKSYAVAKMDEDTKHKDFAFCTTQHINGMEILKLYKATRCGKGFYFFNLGLIHAQRDGKETWAGKQTCPIRGVIDSFSKTGDITIKNKAWWYDEYVTIAEPLRASGKVGEHDIMLADGYSEWLFRDVPYLETIYKNGDMELVENVMKSYTHLPKYMWQAYKVGKRHGLRLNEDNTWRWMNYVYLLRKNGRDYRNPSIVAPKDLVSAHHKMVDIEDRKRRRIEEEKRRRREEEYRRWKEENDKKEREARENYVKDHMKWLGIVIVGGGITIKPLQNIDEFEQEGNAMHHCVYSNRYYAKSDTLIMSARDERGRRLATIEYNLKNNVVVQCRAACNQHPKRYDEIVSLIMNDNRLNAKISA